MKTAFLPLVLVAAVAHAQVFSSGFENNELGQSTLNQGSAGFQTVTAVTANALGGRWTVEAGSVNWVKRYWTPASGNHSVDLSGSAPGRIATQFSTQANTVYTVAFRLAGNPAGLPAVKNLRVTVSPAPAAVSHSFTFSTTLGNSTLSSMGWESRSFQFTGGSGVSTLRFEALDAGEFGPALDDVVVTAVSPQAEPVPEPLTLALGTAGLVAALRRRRTR